MACFSSGDDFYSVVALPVFQKKCDSLVKDAPGSFSILYPALRDKSKVFSLATAYGKLAWSLARMMGCSVDEAQEMIDGYLTSYPAVHQMMLESHEQAKKYGYVTNLYGRPRRMPEAKQIKKFFGNASHPELPYWARNVLNLAVNHRIQSTGASIMNRSAIALWKAIRREKLVDCHIVLQVHDELVVECREEDAQKVAAMLQDAMENTCPLPGVTLQAEPKIAKNLADLK